MVLAIIFLVIFAGCTAFSVYRSIALVKTPMIEVDYKKHFLIDGAFIGGAAISFLVASFGFYQWLNAAPTAPYVVQLVIGALLFVALLLVGVNTFIIHYYGHNIPEKLNKWLFRIMIIGFGLSLVFLFVWTNGLAPYLTYPLINGISFTKGFVSPLTGNPNIAFYALCILSGAILVYFLCDHYMYKEYGKHGTLESTFFVAFPAGIIGGRIGYVIGNWNGDPSEGVCFSERVANGEWWSIFAVWEGGLTILSGAAIGIIVGAAWYMWRNKGKSIWLAADIIVPTILIAQAVGRWGNFFNCEVHGYASPIEYWKWLPQIIYQNGQYSTGKTAPSLLGSTETYVPLFFIEAFFNLLGYFVIAHVFGKALKKHTELGDLGFAYIIWYGLTRVLMEPLRHPDFQMGTKGYWSWIWSMAFVLFGALAIVVNHIVRHLLRKKRDGYHISDKKKSLLAGVIESSLALVIGAALIVVGALLMNSTAFKQEVTYNNFNVGIILLVLGISIALFIAITLIKVVEAIKVKQNNE